MKLKLTRHLWGVEQPWETVFPKIKAEGFVGIETGMPEAKDQERFLSLLKANGFEYIAMAFTGGDSVAAHVKSFKTQLDRAVSLGAVQLTVHSGSDAWPAREAEAFYRELVAIEKESKLVVGHETHRGRVFYNPWVTRDLLEKFEALKLSCDFSHWVCVAERLGWDDPAGSILKLCASRCVHIHSRVGYAEGPQVPDPAAPEYATELATHEKWWDAIWAAQKAAGKNYLTLTPEFGPAAYLHTLPHTNVPVADLWKICKWMADRMAARFA